MVSTFIIIHHQTSLTGWCTVTLNVYSLYTVQLYSTNMLQECTNLSRKHTINTTKAAEHVAANGVTAPVEIALNKAVVEIEVDFRVNAEETHDQI